MMEAYPVFQGLRRTHYIRTFGDYVELLWDNKVTHYLWSGELGFRTLGNSNFLKAVHEDPMPPHLELRENFLEKRLVEAQEQLGRVLERKTVMADLSGGKDSTAQLILLDRLREKIRFNLIAVYVHMPYLEPLENISFAERVAERIGVPFYYKEADRGMIRYFLQRDSLPKRGDRWCTYLKSKALREARKELKADFEAKGDRMLESGKRMKKLKNMAIKTSFINGKTLNLIYDFSAAETAKIVKEHHLVHPHYLQGIPRVSCRFCPYRGLYEIQASKNQEVEDEGFLEDSARTHFRRYYSMIVPWDIFWELSLWRFQPSLARLRLQEMRNVDYGEFVSITDVRRMLASMWEVL
ncbi:MAG: phosphoadenosine phosphosulfate reductase family protein [Infirmifilum sp.]